VTYSIVARDPETGRFGVAVQSHFLSVGPVVPWLEAGVGAIATQASVNISFGPIGLEMLRAGQTAEGVVASLTGGDERSAIRQVGVVDAEGRAAAHTGAECIPACGHRVGDGYTVQGNLLERETCWPAMADAYEAALTRGDPFVERLLLALEAAELEGGDVRGRQSAAIMVVDGEVRPTQWHGHLWGGRWMDLRIEDHPDPVPELRRIVTLHLAYDLSDDDGEAARAGRSSPERFAQARQLAPEAYELVFWRGVELAAGGDVEAGRQELQTAFTADARWRTTLQHLADVGHQGITPELAEVLLA
jgi:uncharacterized Ntn-hydrolase superfamily protein